MQSPPLRLTKTEGLRSGIKDLVSQTLQAWKHEAIQKSWRVALSHRLSEACNWVDKILSAERLGETSREPSSWTQAPAGITDSSTAARGVQPPVPSYRQLKNCFAPALGPLTGNGSWQRRVWEPHRGLGGAQQPLVLAPGRWHYGTEDTEPPKHSFSSS